MESDKVKFRRYQDDLYVSGTGSIIMGAWAVLRVIMEIFLRTDYKTSLGIEDRSDWITIIIMLIILVAIIGLVIFRIHYYIGINAIRAAKGAPFKKGYITATVIMMVVMILSLASYKSLLDDPEYGITSVVVMVLVELTTIYIFAIIIRSNKMINKLKEKMQG